MDSLLLLTGFLDALLRYLELAIHPAAYVDPLKFSCYNRLSLVPLHVTLHALFLG